MTTLDYQDDGVYGQAMSRMKERGWSLAIDSPKFEQTGIEGNTVQYTMTAKTFTLKHGKPQPKDEWDRELMEVAAEMGVLLR